MNKRKVEKKIKMEEEYIKEIKFTEKSQEEKELELILSIIKTKQDLNLAMHNFEYAEGDLIDYYTYQMKANRAKLDYLLKEAKKKRIDFEYARTSRNKI